ncbi:MAG: Rpn family recombination-promoting nuclease/putative transposase, partial [Chitinispirillia bacterium]|nr:Rpn family recombination-promoting nuclease/putative transposase [Chitinispirillia bacterium]
DEIRRVIGMVITERGLIPEDAEYHHRFTLYDIKTGVALTDLIEVHTLELAKLPKENDGSGLWRCLKLLNAETREELDMIAEMSPELKKAAGIMKAYSELDPKTRREYELLMLAEMDDRVRLRAAKKEGRAEGMAEGMAQGMAKIIALIEKGVPLEEAKRLLGVREQKDNL